MNDQSPEYLKGLFKPFKHGLTIVLKTNKLCQGPVPIAVVSATVGHTGGVAFHHSRPQSPRSFWPAAGIESSGLVQHRKSAIHGLPVKSGKSDWLRIRNECSAHAQKIGSGQSSRSLPQARRIVGSGDENEPSI